MASLELIQQKAATITTENLVELDRVRAFEPVNEARGEKALGVLPEVVQRLFAVSIELASEAQAANARALRITLSREERDAATAEHLYLERISDLAIKIAWVEFMGWSKTPHGNLGIRRGWTAVELGQGPCVACGGNHGPGSHIEVMDIAEEFQRRMEQKRQEEEEELERKPN